MIRAVVVLSSVFACAAPPPPPEPAPCPVVEPEPCNAITAEQQNILDAIAEILADASDPVTALRALVAERKAALADAERSHRDLESCARSNAELQERVKQLEADLEELKRLTIEMEMKAK